jgi:histidinol-phosphate aminotransferase
MALSAHQPKLIFIAYPNNPTGNTFDRAVIEEIIIASDALVVLDRVNFAIIPYITKLGSTLKIVSPVSHAKANN